MQQLQLATRSGTAPRSRGRTCSRIGLTFAMIATLGLAHTTAPSPAVAVCGDGVLDIDERCDDGNTESGDCCTSRCTIEREGLACREGDPCFIDGTCVIGTCEGTELDPIECSPGVEGTTCGEQAAPPPLVIRWEFEVDETPISVRGRLGATLTSSASERVEVEVRAVARGLDQRSAEVVVKKRVRLRPDRPKRLRLSLRRVPVQSNVVWTSVELYAHRKDSEGATTLVVPSKTRWLRYDERYRSAEVRGGSSPAEEISPEDIPTLERFTALFSTMHAALLDPPGRVADPDHSRGRLIDADELRARTGEIRFRPGGSTRLHLTGGVAGLLESIYGDLPVFDPPDPGPPFPVCMQWPASYVDAGFGEDWLASAGPQLGPASHIAVRILTVPDDPLEVPQLVHEGYTDADGCVSPPPALAQGNYVVQQCPLWDADGYVIKAAYQGKPQYFGPADDFVVNPDYGSLDLEDCFASTFFVGPPLSPLPPFANVHPSGEDHLTRVGAVISRIAATDDNGFDVRYAEAAGKLRGFKEPRALAVSPDGARVYVGRSRGASVPGAVTVFERDPADGALAFVREIRGDHGGFPVNLKSIGEVALSQDGRHVYVADVFDGLAAMTPTTFPSGGLSYLGQFDQRPGGAGSTEGAYGIAVSPDQKHVYSASVGLDTLFAFARNAFSGVLSPIAEYVDGQGGVQDMNSPVGPVVSPDGAHVYVLGEGVNIFSRDAQTGELAYVGVITDGIDGPVGLIGLNEISISPDGQHLYVVQSYAPELSVFSRDSQSGLLTLVETHTDGQAGLGSLDDADQVAVTPDGGQVLVTARIDEALTVFSRNPLTGALTYLEHHTNGQAGVTGVADGVSLAVSADGKNVYVASRDEDALAVFTRNPATGRLTFLEGQSDHDPYHEAGMAPFFVFADHGCPSGDSPETGYFVAKYGGCSIFNRIYVGTSPFDTTVDDSRYKTVIAHEIGHSVEGILIGETGDNYEMTESIAGLSSMCRCDHVVSANDTHCFQGLEQIGIALTEGWAQFYAVKAFNDPTEGDCTFTYYKEYKEGPEPTATVHLPPVAFDCSQPLRIMKDYCPVVVPGTEVGNEADWMQFFWAAHTHPTEGASLADIKSIVRYACNEEGPQLRDDLCYMDPIGDKDLIEVDEFAAGAVDHFGGFTPEAERFVQSALDAGIDAN